MKIRMLLCLILVLMLLLPGCASKKKTVTCDGCGVEITLSADSNITDEWIVFCKTCEQEKFGGTGVVDGE